ncbi:MAG TPA: universal stress protein [Ktedonobacteraceae bacterium]|nr:universal stress protein [Ktedonobacteraceae bacterium]
MFTKILVPLDGSERAERAILVAARIARASSASILLVRVVEIPGEYPTHFAEPPLTNEHEATKEATDYLNQVAQSKDLTGFEVKTEVLFGAPAAMLLEATKTSHADLIVMCSHGYTGFKRWMLGSVADKMARHTPVPVLILREHGPAPLTPIMVSPVPLRALVPLDGSELSEEALEPTVQMLMTLAPDTAKELHLLRVVDLPAIAGVGKSQAHLTASIIAEAEKEAMDYVVALTHRLQKEIPESSQITISAAVVVDTDVAAAIIKGAEAGGKPDEGGYHGYHLIGMATHGRGALPRWMLGSITERVLHHTNLPLLVVRPGKMVQSEPEKVDVDTDKLHTEAEKGDFPEFPAIL